MILTKTVSFLSSLVVFLNTSHCEESQCNYITDYYQVVYDAQLAYLKGDHEEAYRLLKKAKSKCELLNQPEIRETILCAELSGRKGYYKEAFHYLEKALKNGFKFDYLVHNEALAFLREHPKWSELKTKAVLYQQEFEKSINPQLRAEIVTMTQADQEVRNPPDYKKMKIVDSVHENRVKEIFKTYGYPDERLVGLSVPSQNTDITLMLIHFKDTAWFKPVLYECIKKGICSPNALGAMIDSQDRSATLFTYGIYNNLNSMQIKDFKNLDARRTAIGLRPWKKQREVMELLMAK